MAGPGSGTGGGTTPPATREEIMEWVKGQVEALVDQGITPKDKMDQANHVIMEGIRYYEMLADSTESVSLERIVSAYAAINNQDPDFWNGRSWG